MAIDDQFPWDEIPSGEFMGPTFKVGKRENHGSGYHAHILIYKNGRFVRSGYLLTSDDEVFYVTEHGRDALFNYEKYKKRLIRDIRSDLPHVFDKIPIENLLKPLRKSRTLHVRSSIWN